MHFKYLIYSLILLLLVAGDSNGKARRKLIRARKDIAVPNVYFIHMKASVATEDIHAYIEYLEEEHKKGTTKGFTAEILGHAIEAAHGFSAKLSPVALKSVSIVP